MNFMERPLKWVWAILAVALVLRLGFFSNIFNHPERSYYGDSFYYHRLAHNLLEGAGFSGALAAPYTRDIVRTPGYPLFIAAVSSLCGTNPAAIVFFQNLLDSLSVLLIFFIVFFLCGFRAGIISAFLYALCPSAVIHSQFSIPDTLFVFLLLSGLAGVAYSVHAGSLKWMLLGSALLACSTYVRPVGVWIIFLLGLFSSFSQYRLGWKIAAQWGVCAVAVFLLVLSPWLARNFMLTKTVLFSNIAPQAFIHLHVIPLLSKVEGKSFEEVHADFSRKFLLNHTGMTFEQRGGFSDNLDQGFVKDFVRAGLKEVARYPGAYAAGLAWNSLRMAFLPGIVRSEYVKQLFGYELQAVENLRGQIKELLAQEQWMEALHLFWKARLGQFSAAGRIVWGWVFIFEGSLFLLGLASLCLMFYSRPSNLLKLFCALTFLTVLYFIVPSGLETDLRYRVPADALLCLLGGIFLGGFGEEGL